MCLHSRVLAASRRRVRQQQAASEHRAWGGEDDGGVTTTLDTGDQDCAVATLLLAHAWAALTVLDAGVPPTSAAPLRQGMGAERRCSPPARNVATDAPQPAIFTTQLHSSSAHP
jgi:hypothetical protein